MAKSFTFIVFSVLLGCGLSCRAARMGPDASGGRPVRMKVTDASARTAYDQKRYNDCARDFLVLAKDAKTDVIRAEALYSSACCNSLGGRRNAAFSSLTELIWLRIPSVVAQVEMDEDFLSLHADGRWQDILKLIAEQESTLYTNQFLRKELLERKEIDQETRRRWAAEISNQSLRKEVEEVDAANTTWLKQVIAKYGWPTKTMVGQDGSFVAWLLLQHADKDLTLQREGLALMQIELVKGEVDGFNVAYLMDRIAVAENRPQRYGTQFINDETPFPIEDPAHVDERRASVGLGTMADYKKEMLTQKWKKKQ